VSVKDVKGSAYHLVPRKMRLKGREKRKKIEGKVGIRKILDILD
jgi:hypothetical protein